MKIPTRILDLARGPLLAAAALSCSTSPTPPPIALSAERIVPESVPDPVAYDAMEEAERYARTDLLHDADEASRGSRIADEESRRRQQQRAASVHRRPERWMIRCGRG
jgi:hypothetical protein